MNQCGDPTGKALVLDGTWEADQWTVLSKLCYDRNYEEECGFLKDLENESKRAQVDRKIERLGNRETIGKQSSNSLNSVPVITCCELITPWDFSRWCLGSGSSTLRAGWVMFLCQEGELKKRKGPGLHSQKKSREAHCRPWGTHVDNDESLCCWLGDGDTPGSGYYSHSEFISQDSCLL